MEKLNFTVDHQSCIMTIENSDGYLTIWYQEKDLDIIKKICEAVMHDPWADIFRIRRTCTEHGIPTSYERPDGGLTLRKYVKKKKNGGHNGENGNSGLHLCA